MPKILLYITAKSTWLFVFMPFDINENRAHVHVGKKGTEQYCKIWLEPEIAIEKEGTLKKSELKEIVSITQQYHSELLEQWRKFKNGNTVKIITIKQ
jgi:hypothetical protein